MDRDALDRRLADAFGGTPGERHVVVRQAIDLVDAGRWTETHDGESLTVEHVVTALEDAPAGDALADRWNWWMGSLEVAYGGFEPFAVHRWVSD